MYVFELTSSPRQFIYTLMLTGFVLCVRRHKSKCSDEQLKVRKTLK